jgi:hypothetical protein
VLFSVLGVGLIVLGWWGARNAERLGLVPHWDQKSVDRRKRVMRRGAMTCLGVGALLLLASGISLFSGPPR